MSEPLSAAIGPFVISGGTIWLTGSIFGLEYESMIAGFIGGFIALAFMQATTRTRATAMIFASAGLAGFITPVLAAIAVARFPVLKIVDVSYVRGACACLTGLGAHVAIPALLRRLQALGHVGAGGGDHQ